MTITDTSRRVEIALACAATMLAPWHSGIVPAHALASAGNAFPHGSYMMADGFGFWRFTFDAAGTFTVNLNDVHDVVLHGRFVIGDDHITLSDESEVCGGKGDGEYAWRWDGVVLTMVTVSDKCTLWRFALTKGLTPINAQTMSRRLEPGGWVARVTRKDAPLFPQLVGAWQWRIAADGSFALAKDGALVQQGGHFILGDKVRFIAGAETFPCFIPNSHDPLERPETFKPGVMRAAVYRWRLDSGTPRLQHLSDWCHARRFLWTRVAWMRE